MSSLTFDEDMKRQKQERRSKDFAADLDKMAVGQVPRAPQKWRVPAERFGSLGTMVGDVVCAKLPTSVAFKDLLDGDMWKTVHRHLKPGQFVVCLADDLSWVGLVVVV